MQGIHPRYRHQRPSCRERRRRERRRLRRCHRRTARRGHQRAERRRRLGDFRQRHAFEHHRPRSSTTGDATGFKIFGEAVLDELGSLGFRRRRYQRRRLCRHHRRFAGLPEIRSLFSASTRIRSAISTGSICPWRAPSTAATVSPYRAPDPTDQLGYAVSHAGDVNADGYDEVIISAPSADLTDDPNAGRRLRGLRQARQFCARNRRGRSRPRASAASSSMGKTTTTAPGGRSPAPAISTTTGSTTSSSVRKPRRPDGLGNGGRAYIVLGPGDRDGARPRSRRSRFRFRSYVQ